MGIGWIIVQREQAPPAEKFYPIPAQAWAAYRGPMVTQGFISEEKASEIASSLVDTSVGKRVALETEKPNPDGVGL